MIQHNGYDDPHDFRGFWTKDFWFGRGQFWFPIVHVSVGLAALSMPLWIDGCKAADSEIVEREEAGDGR